MLKVEIDFKDVEVTAMVRATTDKKCGPPCGWKVPKVLLRNVNGHVPAGSLVALMGASGAGKTTLLHALSGRADLSSGSVTYNGGPIDAKRNEAFTFIKQEDMFLGNLTVEEHLKTQVNLRLPKGTSKDEKAKIVENILARVRLTKCKNNRIGNLAAGEGRGISGGERKRLNIASELLTSPSVIFADEPTTGLDSALAISVVKLLRELADDGHTVICVIHQPSTRILSLFHSLLLLSSGRVVFEGQIDAAVQWFTNLGFPCPMYANPGDFFIKLLSLPQDTEERDEKTAQIEGWCDRWDADGRQFIEEFNAGESASAPPANDDHDDDKLQDNNELQKKTKRIGWFEEVWHLTARASKVNVRDPILFRARVVQTFLLGLVIGFLFFRLGLNPQDSLSKMGATFTLLLNQTLVSGLGVVNSFPKEKPIILGEVQGGVCRSGAYTVAKMLADTPYQVLFPIIFNSIVYFMIGFNDDFGRFCLATLILLFTALAGVSLGYVTSATSASGEEALQKFQLLIMPLALFSGFLAQSDSLSDFWIWMEYISPFKHGLDGYSTAVFKDLELEDEDGNYMTGDDFLMEMFGIRTDQYWLSLVFLLLLLLVLRALAGIAVFVKYR